MARAMDSVQAERAGRSHIAPIPLVKLTLYSDRPTGTVAKTFYLSNMAVDYNYGATGTDQRFLPVVIGGGDFFSGISQIGQPDNPVAFGQSFDLQCSNKSINGKRLIELLQAYNLEDASIEIAEFQVDKIDSLPVDLTSYDGDEHYVLFSGRVNQIAPITDAMLTIQCTTQIPSIANSWNYAPQSFDTDQRDVGKRYPRIYGNAKRVSLVNISLMDITTLTEDVPATTPGAYGISDGRSWPASTADGFFRQSDSVAEGSVDLSSITPTSITVDAPGTSGSYLVGDFVMIQGDSVWIISDRQCHAVNEIYIRNPETGLLVRLDSALYSGSVDLDYTAGGGHWTVLTLTAAQVEVIGDEVLGASFAMGIPKIIDGFELFADVEGIMGQLGATALEDGENFDDGTWEVVDCTVAVDTGDKIEGTGSQKMTIAAPTVPIPTDDDTDWSGDDCTVTVEAGEGHTEGSGLIQAVSTTSSQSSDLIYELAALNLDLGDNGAGIGFLTFDFRMRRMGSVNSHLNFVLASSSGNSWVWQIPESFIAHSAAWYTITLYIPDASATLGSPDISAIDIFSVNFGFVDPRITETIWVDNIRAYVGVNAVIQNNDVGGLDWSGQDLYSVQLKPNLDSVRFLNAARVYFSDDVGSDSTKTAEYREVFIEGGAVEDAWTELDSVSFADTGTIDDIDVNTLRVELDLLVVVPTLTRDRITIPGVQTINVDDFRFASAVESTWDAAAGDPLIHPADIIRHWIDDTGGETYDTTSYAALITALGAAAEWGFDVRSIGFTWEEVLQRMAFEARCNVFPVETATGRVWVMSSADLNYGFGEATAVITQTHNMVDEGRAVANLANHFSFRYAFDHAVGSSDESAFAGIINATPSVSDVPIDVAHIIAAQARYGPLDNGPISFRCIQDEDTALDVAGYYVQERMANNRRVFRLSGVAWFDALPYILGDLVLIAAPWASAATNCRILSMTKAFAANTWVIIAVEVPVTGLHT